MNRREVLGALGLDGVPMAYDIFVLKKDGCVYDLVYVAPPDAAGQGAGAAVLSTLPSYTP